MEGNIKPKIKTPDAYFDWEAIRRSTDYLDLLRFGLVGDLEKLSKEINYEEVPRDSIEAMKDYLKSKGWQELVDFDELIKDTDLFYEQNAGVDPNVSLKNFLETDRAKNAMSEEGRENLLIRIEKETGKSN